MMHISPTLHKLYSSFIISEKSSIRWKIIERIQQIIEFFVKQNKNLCKKLLFERLNTNYTFSIILYSR